MIVKYLEDGKLREWNATAWDFIEIPLDPNRKRTIKKK